MTFWRRNVIRADSFCGEEGSSVHDTGGTVPFVCWCACVAVCSSSTLRSRWAPGSRSRSTTTTWCPPTTSSAPRRLTSKTGFSPSTERDVECSKNTSCQYRFTISLTLHHYQHQRGSVVRTSVFGWRTFPDLRLIYGWHMTTLWVRCPLLVNQPGQLSLPSLWINKWVVMHVLHGLQGWRPLNGRPGMHAFGRLVIGQVCGRRLSLRL